MTRFTKRVARIAALTVVAGLLMTGAARAQVGDFLSKSKGEVESFGGALDDGDNKDGLGNFSGSFSIPLIGGFHLQGDGLIGGGGDTNWALGGHLYWHDKDIGLIDFNIAHLDFTTRDITRLGLHGQYYLGIVTIKGNIGFQLLNRGGRDSLFGGLSVDLFATPNLKLQVGGSGYRGQGIGYGMIQYQLPLSRWFGQPASVVPPLSAYINGGAGNNGYWHVVAGIKLSLGCRGTLLSISRNCGRTTNQLPKWIMTLRPAARDGGGDGSGHDERGIPPAGAVPSDGRLKTDIVRIGTLANGIGLYHFRYILGGPAHIGVMAQEVLMVRPDAVVMDRGGFYKVDYRALGIRMITLN